MSGSGMGHAVRDAVTGFVVGTGVTVGTALGTPGAALANSSLDTVDNAAQTSVVESMEHVQDAANGARESYDQESATERDITGLSEETSAEYRDAEQDPGTDFWADVDSLAEQSADDAVADTAPEAEAEAGADAGPDGGNW